MAEISEYFDKAFAGQAVAELADAPVSALKGVSDADEEALIKALNIKTVRDLAQNKFVLMAQEVVAAAKK